MKARSKYFAFFLPVLVAHHIFIQGVGDNALELVAEGIRHEFLDVHDGHVVLTAEPVAPPFLCHSPATVHIPGKPETVGFPRTCHQHSFL